MYGMGLNIAGSDIESSNCDINSSLYRVRCCTIYGQRVRLQNTFYFHFLHEENFFSCVFFRSLASKKGKAVPLQSSTGPEGSRKLRLPDFVTAAQNGGRLST